MIDINSYISDKYYYDEAEAQRVCGFFEKVLVHSKGREWAGKPFVLENWERDFISALFGIKRYEDGFRRFRTGYLEIPKKNGKSTICSGIALYLTFADHEPGAEVYSAAGNIRQANIVFEEAATMFLNAPLLRKRGKKYRKSIVNFNKHGVPIGRYEVLSSESDTKHGFNVSGLIFDELHTQPNRKLWETLKKGVISRDQPLVVAITTAGFDRNSICWEVHQWAERIINGEEIDDTFLGVIYKADEKDDWADPVIWKKANPNLGVSVKLDALKTECVYAQNNPAAENDFRRLHLNQWVEQEIRYIPMKKWDLCNKPIDIEALKGRRCYGGLDLSTRHDLTAFVLVFPPQEENEPYKVLPHFFLPRENLKKKGEKDRVSYEAWEKMGLIDITEGSVVDPKYVIKKIEDLNEVYNIQEIAFDRWGAIVIRTELEERGFTMVQFGQGMASMSAPTKEMLDLILEEKLIHGGNPILRWNASSMTVKQDPAGNVKPVKPDRMKDQNRIDGIVAMIMGLDRAIVHKPEAESPYKERGLLFV